MSKFIFVSYSSDFGMGASVFDTKQDAFDAMIRYIEDVFDVDFDTFDGEPDFFGHFSWHTPNRHALNWGDDWANCYGDDGNEEHCAIFEVC